MSNEKNSFGRLMDLFKGLPKLITTDNASISQSKQDGDQLVVPINDLVLIDAKCGSRCIIQHGNTIKRFIASQNKILFNGVKCSVAFLIEHDKQNGKFKIYNALYSTETLAIHCSKVECPFESVGNDPTFIGDPKNYDFTRYTKTSQEGFYIRQQFKIDISANLEYSIDEKGITASVVFPNQSQSQASQ